MHRRIGFILALTAVLASGAPRAVGAAEPDEGEPGSPIDSKFELFVNDPAASTRFYKLLGFEVVEQKKRGYTTLQSGSVEIALSPVRTLIPLRWLGFLRNPPFGTEIVLYVKSDDLAPLQRKLIHAGHRTSLIERKRWGLRDFRARDPEGYYVRVSEIAPPEPEPQPEPEPSGEATSEPAG